MPTSSLVLPTVGRGDASPLRRSTTLRSVASSGSLRRRVAPGRPELAVGGRGAAAATVDFRQLTEPSLENREQQMREALRLPPTPVVVRPLSVGQNRAEMGASSVPRPLGIRGLIARGSGATAVRQQREHRQAEVQLPEVRREAAPRAEPQLSVRQRLEEQEQALQQQLQEQAELQLQLQQHLEQEQQLQRELREQLEREIQDFNHLEELVSSNFQGTGPEATETPAAQVQQTQSGMVEVAGIGPLPREQLENLEALLNGQDVTTGAENLPDLSALSSTQLEHLEAELSRGLVSSTSGVETRVEGTPDAVLPPQERVLSLHDSSDGFPLGDPEVLDSHQAAPQRQPPEMMPREVGHVTSAWRLKEAALESLQVKVAPELECSICCEMLSAKEVVALPCETRGCRSFFHTECIRPWLERNPSCPLCRDTLPQLVRPATPLPQGTGNPLLDLWFLAMAMQRQERENMTRHRQSTGPSLADLQGVVFTASALVDLLSSHLGFDDRGLGDLEDGPNLDMALQSMLVNNLSGREDSRASPQIDVMNEVPPTLQGSPGNGNRPVNSFQEQILRSAAAMELRSDRSPHP